MAAVKPVILLAFANDPADGINYLRNLPAEERRIRAALETAAAQGLCDFEVRYNATLDDILAAFQQPKLRGRVAIFHYGGHADSYELLLQSGPGNLQRVDGRGFAAFLAEQRGLQLVFLNACTTEPQVEGLLAADVPVVIATTQEVDDAAAADLAARFYAELARGASIGAAYRQAVAALRAAKGDDPALFYTPGGAPPPGPQTSSSAPPVPPVPPSTEAGGAASGGLWPWLLRTRRGAEGAVEWSLPQAAGDPLFGLPPLPPRPLPSSPYQRALDYYTRDLAELFFGRGRQIRDLYQRVTAPGHSSVLLYYGQSGVGKSSLLDAGLAPRLEPIHAVLYARRDRTVGLLGTLQKQLAALGAQTSSSAPPAEQTGTSALQGKEQTRTSAVRDSSALLSAWLAAEAQLGKPLILILDQVEEVFSRRNPDLPQELAEFAAALGEIDGGRQPRPAGALLLGFRKERLAEVEAALRSTRVDFAKLFLEPLDEEGIEEILWGPVRSERLRAKYNLGVEDDLPAAVAHDLSADPDSPVAPTLNILLRKLWAAATAQAASAPRFTLALYEHLRREGILLDDFLRQQTATLAQEQPDAVASGLLLDLWAFHTTALGTSDQRDAAEIKAAYPQPGVDALIGRSKELYVLADPGGDRAGEEGEEGGTRLAHDTLAPLVRRDFATSTLPGQQARRLLESRAVDWDGGRSGPLLDDAALAAVDKGLAGMRALSEAESRLLAASREAQAQRARSRRLWRAGALAAAAALLALLAITFLAWDSGRLAAERADRAAAEQAAAEARADREAAERQAAEERTRAGQLSTQLANERQQAAAREAQTNESRRLADLAQQQLAIDPVTSLHLALAALPTGADAPDAPEAEYALRQAALASRERALITTTVSAPDAVAIRGDRVAVGGQSPAVYTLGLQDAGFALPPDFTAVEGLRWGNDGRLLGWRDDRAWVLGGGEPQRFDLPAAAVDAGDAIRCAEWQPAGRWVAVCTYNALYAWEPASGRAITLTTGLDDPEIPTERRGAAWSPDGRWLAGWGSRLAVWDSRTPDAPAQMFDESPAPGSSVAFAFWLPDEALRDNSLPLGAQPEVAPPDAALLAGWAGPEDRGVRLVRWNAGAAAIEPVALSPDVDDYTGVTAVYTPTFDREPRLLLWSMGGLLAYYGLDGQQLAAAPPADAAILGIAFAPDGAGFAVYNYDGSMTLYRGVTLTPSLRLDAGSNFAADIIFDALWLDDQALLLLDRSDLLQVMNLNRESLEFTMTPLARLPDGEGLAAAARVGGGRLLTADYGGSGSLRLWQADPVLVKAGAPGAGDPAGRPPALPPDTAPLCERLQRGLERPGGMVWPEAAAWLPGDSLLVTEADGQAGLWALGGQFIPLPVDSMSKWFAFAPGEARLLRYDRLNDGQIWRWSGTAWVQEGLVAGAIAAADWTPYGLLVQFNDGSAVALDPDSGERQALPPGMELAGSTLVAPGQLVALRENRVELWPVGGDQPRAAWTAPEGRFLYLADAAADGQLLVYQDNQFGQLYVLRADATTGALAEVWRSEEAHVVAGQSQLSPLLPLLATINDGVLAVVDLDRGETLWTTRSAAPVAGQFFRKVQWSTDGQYLITQAQPSQASIFENNVGVWRWDPAAGAPVLLQEMRVAHVVGVRPDMQWLLASEARPGALRRVLAWPLLLDAAQLGEDVEASCLLHRQLSAAERQAFLIGGE